MSSTQSLTGGTLLNLGGIFGTALLGALAARYALISVLQYRHAMALATFQANGLRAHFRERHHLTKAFCYAGARPSERPGAASLASLRRRRLGRRQPGSRGSPVESPAGRDIGRRAPPD